jgi:hypothetical protein
MNSYVETALWILAVTLAVAVVAFFLLRWMALRIGTRLAHLAEKRLAGTVASSVARTRVTTGVPPVVLSDAERRKFLAEIDRLAWLMDRVIPLPIIGGVGLDALLGLAPVLGDVVSLAISSVLVTRAAKLGAPPELIGRLIAIQCIDLVLGAVPVVGDIVDAGYHANERSVALIRDWLNREP